MASKKLAITERFRMNSVRDRISRARGGRRYKRITQTLQRRPFLSFFLALGLLFAFILLGSILSNLNKKEEPERVVVKDVSTYRIDGVPKVTVQAQIDKAGVVQIVAQNAGVVQSIPVKEGDTVTRGQTLVQLSTTYNGGNAPALQLQLAQRQYQNTLDTYNTQKDLIGKQREVADATTANTEELRRIASDSAGDVQNLLNFSEGQLRDIDETISVLEATNIGGINEPLIAQANQARGQLLSGVVQLRGQVRQLNSQADEDAPPARLSDLQKDITVKQLEIQEKAPDLSRDAARIQRDLAGVQASTMTPSSPCAGSVERIHVRVGQTVAPGTPIATIKTNNTAVTAEALVPSEIAASVSRSEPSTITLQGKTYSVTPYFVSGVATQGQLYSVLYSLPEGLNGKVTDGAFTSVEIPLGYSTGDATPYIPLDAVYLTQSEAYVYVAQNGKAASKKVTLGDVYGKFVTVTGGLSDSDIVILNRNIVTGDRVKTN
jgi:membrane fusion protein, multidrug efflux system